MLDGKALKKEMRKRGLSLSKMAMRMGGIPFTTVHQWTRTETNAYIETILRACAALDDITIYRLLPTEIIRKQTPDLLRYLAERKASVRTRKKK
jgi:transcriptional regulator with XRE-family HTH domain